MCFLSVQVIHQEKVCSCWSRKKSFVAVNTVNRGLVTAVVLSVVVRRSIGKFLHVLVRLDQLGDDEDDNEKVLDRLEEFEDQMRFVCDLEFLL